MLTFEPNLDYPGYSVQVFTANGDYIGTLRHRGGDKNAPLFGFVPAHGASADMPESPTFNSEAATKQWLQANRHLYTPAKMLANRLDASIRAKARYWQAMKKRFPDLDIDDLV